MYEHRSLTYTYPYGVKDAFETVPQWTNADNKIRFDLVRNWSYRNKHVTCVFHYTIISDDAVSSAKQVVNWYNSISVSACNLLSPWYDLRGWLGVKQTLSIYLVTFFLFTNYILSALTMSRQMMTNNGTDCKGISKRWRWKITRIIMTMTKFDINNTRRRRERRSRRCWLDGIMLVCVFMRYFKLIQCIKWPQYSSMWSSVPANMEANIILQAVYTSSRWINTHAQNRLIEGLFMTL